MGDVISERRHGMHGGRNMTEGVQQKVVFVPKTTRSAEIMRGKCSLSQEGNLPLSPETRIISSELVRALHFRLWMVCY